MKRSLARSVCAAVAVSSLVLVVPLGRGATAAPAARDVVPGQYIVVFHDWVSNPGAEAAAMANEHGLGILHTYEHALKGFAATVPGARLQRLRSDARVDFISEDRIVQATAQTLPTGIDRIEGDLSTAKSGDGAGTVNVAVAVIDTGIDVDHPDLNVVGGKNCSTGRRFDDGNGHGTHVAGTIAAKDDGNGVVGIVPGAPLYAVRVLNNSGSGSTATVVCGIDWVAGNATAKGIKVANMSLGGGGADDGNCGNSNNDAMHKAICNAVGKGVTFVVAAGNSNVNFQSAVPAAYNEVLTVTASADFNGQPGGGAPATCRADVDDTAADFSNFTTVGSSDEGHTVAAPGVCILSTWKGGGNNTISGTSMATPHVAGTAALCIGGPCAGMAPAQVIARLRSDAAARPATYGFTDDPNTPSGNRYYGYLVYAGGY